MAANTDGDKETLFEFHFFAPHSYVGLHIWSVFYQILLLYLPTTFNRDMGKLTVDISFNHQQHTFGF